MGMNNRLLRPRARGFNPNSIPGLKIWYDVANTASMTFNGSTVSQINDLSGNGFHATQETANNQPTYSATGANGRPRLAFDTTDSLTSSATIADYILNPTTGPAFTLVMACYSPGISLNGQIVFGSDSQANGRVLFSEKFGGGGGSLIFDTANVTGGRMISAGSFTQPDADVPRTYTFYRHTASMAVRIDGAQVLSKANASGNFTATTARLQIGKCDGGGANVMYVSEVLVYAAVLTASQIAKAERGLGRKWGITVA